MNNLKPAEVFPPGDFIKDEIKERGWTQIDLAKIMGRPVPMINQVILGKKSITPETAVGLANAFGTSAELWMNLESAYQLSKVSNLDSSGVRARAELFERAPIKDIEKRGWIKKTQTIEELRKEVEGFYSLTELSTLKAAARSSTQSSELSSEQMAWCVRALHIAKTLPANPYTAKSFDHGIHRLRALTNFPENVREVPKVLSEMGIRFVVIEHLPKSMIDGAALWLGDGWDKPVIALSLRYDRIDSFWHTLFHECSHIKNKDSYIVDVDIVGADRCLSNEALSEIETRANEEAAAWLIPKGRLLSFISRTRPFYSTERIIQFANLIKIHPGIIAGQLQYQNEIDWSAHRKMLVKIRDILVKSAMTDGWGVAFSK